MHTLPRVSLVIVTEAFLCERLFRGEMHTRTTNSITVVHSTQLRQLSILYDWFTDVGLRRDTTLDIKYLGKHNLEQFLDIDAVAGGAKNQWGLHGVGEPPCLQGKIQ